MISFIDCLIWPLPNSLMINKLKLNCMNNCGESCKIEEQKLKVSCYKRDFAAIIGI